MGLTLSRSPGESIVIGDELAIIRIISRNYERTMIEVKTKSNTWVVHKMRGESVFLGDIGTIVVSAIGNRVKLSFEGCNLPIARGEVFYSGDVLRNTTQGRKELTVNKCETFKK
jgi:sRNA-binding carbon storage regulator CsrA